MQIYSKIYKFSLIPGDVSVELLEMNYNGYIRHQHSSNLEEVMTALVQKSDAPSYLME